MTGEPVPDEDEEIENASVIHDPMASPATTVVTEVVPATGPANTNDVKSYLILQMSVEQGQTVYVQGLVRAVTDVCIRKVLFSDFVEPHASSNLQQTPKPSAQDPSLVPPLLEHSSAV